MSTDGGPAFPLATGWVETTGDRGQKIVVVRELDRGMSLRDYFAGQAMTGLNANTVAEVVSLAYEIADAMLVERAKCKT